MPLTTPDDVLRIIDRDAGILRLAPAWVPRAFLAPGGRLRLHPDDLFYLGSDRGGIDERWLASATPADNPGAPPDEGLSYVVHDNRRVLTLRDAIAAVGPRIIGEPLWSRYARWPVLGKLFDNDGPIPLHLHHSDALAAAIGRQGKPEAYYFPPQYNSVTHRFPYTFFGLDPSVTRDDLRRRLERWSAGDNHVLEFSRSHALRTGTGWLVPAGLLHAPGSLVTFEPQWGSDVFSIFQNMLDGRPLSRELLVKDVPPHRRDDLDYVLDLVDWPANTDPHFRARHFLSPRAAAASDASVLDAWVVYGLIHGRQLFSARELTLPPGGRAIIRDGAPSGLLVTQGHGTIGLHTASAPVMIRYGSLTRDEFFVTADAATTGVPIENRSDTEPFVLLRYFGPDAHADMPEIERIEPSGM